MALFSSATRYVTFLVTFTFYISRLWMRGNEQSRSFQFVKGIWCYPVLTEHVWKTARSLESCSSSETLSITSRLLSSAFRVNTECCWKSQPRDDGQPRSHLDGDGVLSMFGLVCEMWFLCASVPNQHLKKRRGRIRKSAGKESVMH